MNQELEGDLENAAIANPGVIVMRATEKKTGYGRTICMFDVGIHLPSAPKEGVFFTLNRARDNMGDEIFVPVYRSKVSKLAGGKASWTKVLIDTDTLNDDNNDQNILIQVFEHRPGDTSIKVGQAITKLSELKAG
jgi:hypothetical protein